MLKIKLYCVLPAVVVSGVMVVGCGPQSAETPPREERPVSTESAAPDDPLPPEVPATKEAPRPRPAGPDGSRVRVGEEAPDFTVTTTDGKKFRLSEQRGKVVLINFFATWCAPCKTEMPYLQKEVFEKIKGERFAMIALGREDDNAEVAGYKEKRRLGFPMAGDRGRAVFDRYAEKSIPRTLVVGADGRVLFQSIGFSDRDFREMVSLIRAKLQRRS